MYIVYERNTDVKVFQGTSDQVWEFIRESERKSRIYAYNNVHPEFDIVPVGRR